MARKPSGKRRNTLAIRIIFMILGAGFVLWSVTLLTLYFFGEPKDAVITHIRREMGERPEVIPNRYTLIIGYSFQLEDGRTIEGYSRKISNPVFLKPDGNSRIQARYFKAIPFVNAMETDTAPGIRHVIIMLVGVSLSSILRLIRTTL